jgi:hypothetical protein
MTSADERWILPEIDNYNWILDRDPGHGDILLLLVNRNGERSLILINRTDWTVDWNDLNFQSILADEELRHEPKFTMDEKDRDYLRNCASLYITSETQFCAILPIDHEEYSRQHQKSIDKQLFEPLESLLKVSILLQNIDHAYKQWCLCKRPWNDNSPPMIECNNAKCKLGWYHKKCVKLNKADCPEFWLCPTCKTLPTQERSDTKDLDLKYDKVAETSSWRVQRTRAVHRAWNQHAWPEADAILNMFNKIALNLDIVKSAAYTIHRNGVHEKRKFGIPRYWVLSKHKPQKLVLAGSREWQTVYHPEAVDEDTESSSIDDEN